MSLCINITALTLYGTVMKKLLITALVLVPTLALAQSGGWGLPSDNAAAWGANSDSLNPSSPAGIKKLDKEQPNPLNNSVLPETKVVSPFDDNGVYMGQSQAYTGAGVDPATGVSVVDTPRQ